MQRLLTSNSRLADPPRFTDTGAGKAESSGSCFSGRTSISTSAPTVVLCAATRAPRHGPAGGKVLTPGRSPGPEPRIARGFARARSLCPSTTEAHRAPRGPSDPATRASHSPRTSGQPRSQARRTDAAGRPAVTRIDPSVGLADRAVSTRAIATSRRPMPRDAPPGTPGSGTTPRTSSGFRARSHRRRG
jgi:hypothetical protein